MTVSVNIYDNETYSVTKEFQDGGKNVQVEHVFSAAGMLVKVTAWPVGGLQSIDGQSREKAFQHGQYADGNSWGNNVAADFVFGVKTSAE